MRIGIQCLAYNCENTFTKLISPWIKLKDKYDIKIWVGSGQFKEYKEMGCEDLNSKTIELFKTTHKYDIDFLWTPDENISDHETRNKCISYFKEQDIDLMIQLDADEFYTEEEVSNFIKFIEENPENTTYITTFRNVIGDGEIENFNRFSAGWIKRHGGIDHYYFDCHWVFKGDSGVEIEYRTPKSIVIPIDLVNPFHYTWTNRENTTGPSNIKEKIDYQNRIYSDGCGFIWDNENKIIKKR